MIEQERKENEQKAKYNEEEDNSGSSYDDNDPLE